MSDKSALPIGIFDSGLGGLTVVKQIIKLLPNENIIYLGDNARVPYGGRSKETVTKFSFENARFLLSQNVKCIVIACNTSSALAGDELKNKMPVPVFDVITPAVFAAKSISAGGKIGVIGTRGTIGSHAYPFDIQKACPLFVPFIEEGEMASPALKIVVKEYLRDLEKDNIDTLILGCTHYPIIEKLISEDLGGNVQIVDPGESIAKTVKDYLAGCELLNTDKTEGERKYYVTDLTDRFVKVAEMFLGHKIEHNLAKVDLSEVR